jgi:hypothetical protein
LSLGKFVPRFVSPKGILIGSDLSVIVNLYATDCGGYFSRGKGEIKGGKIVIA